MLKKKNNVKSVTACVDKKYCLDIQKCIFDNIETVGCSHVFMDGDKVYVGFDTKESIPEVAKVIGKKMNVKTNIVGGMVFVK